MTRAPRNLSKQVRSLFETDDRHIRVVLRPRGDVDGLSRVSTLRSPSIGVRGSTSDAAEKDLVLASSQTASEVPVCGVVYRPADNTLRTRWRNAFCSLSPLPQSVDAGVVVAVAGKAMSFLGGGFQVSGRRCLCRRCNAEPISAVTGCDADDRERFSDPTVPLSEVVRGRSCPSGRGEIKKRLRCWGEPSNIRANVFRVLL